MADSHCNSSAPEITPEPTSEVNPIARVGWRFDRAHRLFCVARTYDSEGDDPDIERLLSFAEMAATEAKSAHADFDVIHQQLMSSKDEVIRSLLDEIQDSWCCIDSAFQILKLADWSKLEPSIWGYPCSYSLRLIEQQISALRWKAKDEI